jgi:hypothetical protein
MKDPKETPQYKWQKNIMNQMCNNLEKSSKVPFMKTPERSVEEYEEEYYRYVSLAEGYTMTKKEFFDGIKDLLQAERQKRDDVVREALEEAGNYVDELYQSGNMGENEYEALTDFFDEKLLTQPNHQK